MRSSIIGPCFWDVYLPGICAIGIWRETLQTLMEHLSRRQPQPKIVVWEHNSPLGEARATEMGERGELNVGQLVREHYGVQAVLIGFTSDNGPVTAASDWGGPMERKVVQPALAESI